MERQHRSVRGHASYDEFCLPQQNHERCSFLALDDDDDVRGPVPSVLGGEFS